MVDNVSLVHMNGRVHDPILGRFISADPRITRVGVTQNYNRYSYVYNRPLSLVDMNGFDPGGPDMHAYALALAAANAEADRAKAAAYEEIEVTAWYCDEACHAANQRDIEHSQRSANEDRQAAPSTPTPAQTAAEGGETGDVPEIEVKGYKDKCEAYNSGDENESVVQVKNQSESDIAVQLGNNKFRVARGNDSGYHGVPPGNLRFDVAAPAHQAFQSTISVSGGNLYTLNVHGAVDRVFYGAMQDLMSPTGFRSEFPNTSEFFSASSKPLFPIRIDFQSPLFRDFSLDANFGCIR